jgi:hypothetical protein
VYNFADYSTEKVVHCLLSVAGRSPPQERLIRGGGVETS